MEIVVCFQCQTVSPIPFIKHIRACTNGLAIELSRSHIRHFRMHALARSELSIYRESVEMDVLTSIRIDNHPISS